MNQYPQNSGSIMNAGRVTRSATTGKFIATKQTKDSRPTSPSLAKIRVYTTKTTTISQNRYVQKPGKNAL